MNYFAAFINGGGTAAVTNIRASARVEADLAAGCDGALDVLPDPARPEPAACAAMPSTIGDSERCALAAPHGVEACPKKVVPPSPVQPEPREGCDCRSGGQAPRVATLLSMLWLGRRSRR